MDRTNVLIVTVLLILAGSATALGAGAWTDTGALDDAIEPPAAEERASTLQTHVSVSFDSKEAQSSPDESHPFTVTVENDPGSNRTESVVAAVIPSRSDVWVELPRDRSFRLPPPLHTLGEYVYVGEVEPGENETFVVETHAPADGANYSVQVSAMREDVAGYGLAPLATDTAFVTVRCPLDCQVTQTLVAGSEYLARHPELLLALGSFLYGYYRREKLGRLLGRARDVLRRRFRRRGGSG